MAVQNSKRPWNSHTRTDSHRQIRNSTHPTDRVFAVLCSVLSSHLVDFSFEIKFQLHRKHVYVGHHLISGPPPTEYTRNAIKNFMWTHKFPSHRTSHLEMGGVCLSAGDGDGDGDGVVFIVSRNIFEKNRTMDEITMNWFAHRSRSLSLSLRLHSFQICLGARASVIVCVFRWARARDVYGTEICFEMESKMLIIKVWR